MVSFAVMRLRMHLTFDACVVFYSRTNIKVSLYTDAHLNIGHYAVSSLTTSAILPGCEPAIMPKTSKYAFRLNRSLRQIAALSHLINHFNFFYTLYPSSFLMLSFHVLFANCTLLSFLSFFSFSFLDNISR